MSIDPKNLSGTAVLTFSENFNSLKLWDGTSGLDTRPGFAMGAWADNGFSWGGDCWYLQPNALNGATSPFSISNGILAITPQRAATPYSDVKGTYNYSTGAITTFNEHAQTYGYFEMRAKVTSPSGTNFAFWLLNKNGTWPPELDVMEVLGRSLNEVNTTVHSQSSGTMSIGPNHFQSSAITTVSDTSSAFHTYGVDWQAEYITWYFDGNITAKFATPADMHSPMYIIVSADVGSPWAGEPDPTSLFNAKYEIDYIRSYASILPSIIATPIIETPVTAKFLINDSVVDGTANSGSVANLQQQLIGTEADGVVFGTPENDFINLLGGTDAADGGAGDDVIDGGPGVDTLVVDLPYRLSGLSFTASLGNAGYVSSTGVSYNGLTLSGTLTAGGETDSFSQIEAIQFADGRLVFDPADPIGQVTRMYYAALGRAPDPLGLKHWADYVGQGHSILELAQAFVDSLEFNARYPAVDNPGFVTLLYQNTLSRAPDPGGLAAWTSNMDNGLTPAQTLTHFSESTEHYNRTAGLWTNGIWDMDETGADVAHLYYAALGRAPDTGGWQVWTDYVKAGYSAADLAAAFPASAEFQTRYPSVDNAGYVRLLYENTLGREPDQGGYDAWLGYMNAGHSRVELLQLFADSGEFIARTLPLIDGGITFA